MFTEWDYLLAEIWVLLALAALVGLIAGWLIFGGRPDTGADADEIRRLRAELDRERARSRGQSTDPLDDVPAMQGGGYTRPSPMTAATRTTTPAPAPQTINTAPDPLPDAAAPSIPEPVAPLPADDTTKPKGLSEPRDGLSDDLTKIKGIGPKMEKLCNSLGYWHYDQIAAWTPDEVAWVDNNLEGFKGRVTRDEWVKQAKALSAPTTPAFVRRKD